MNLTLRAAREESGVQVHDVSYDSPKGGRVTGLLFVPSGAGPHAGIIVQHGLPGAAAGVGGDAVLFAAHGAVVLAIDAPFARRGGPPVSFAQRDSTEQVPPLPPPTLTKMKSPATISQTSATIATPYHLAS